MSNRSTCPQQELLFQISRNLKALILQDKDQLDQIKKSASEHNPWFTNREIDRMLDLIFTNYLDEANISKWLATYQFDESEQRKSVGIVSAGNIPLASFQDVWCALACGYKIQLKLSSKDQVLSKYFYDKINELISDSDLKIQFVEQVSHIDALIASGSNLTANHFSKFKDRFPCLVRAHKNGIAILSGNETEEELIQLGSDIFSFYGLGCRNVTKIYIPDISMIKKLAQSFDSNFAYIRDSSKYNNNYEYQLAILSLNRNTYLQAETVLFNESVAIYSSIAVVNYEVYHSISEMVTAVQANLNIVQCIVSNMEGISLNVSKLGKAQWPELWDYQDNVDVIHFLQNRPG